MIRVRVEIVPWGQEHLAEEIAVLEVGRDNPEDHDDRTVSGYKATLVDGSTRTDVGKFRLHRFGWYRNRLGLASSALRLLQDQRDEGRCLPAAAPFRAAPPLATTSQDQSGSAG